MAVDYELVVGLEVHVQLGTRTKLFCACPNDAFGREPNTAVCPVCTGQPGVLPVLNARAVELAYTAALALGCRLPARSVFARKNYFYPDLPKGYQISQYEEPFSVAGRLALPGGGAVGITRIHMEEDAGKLLHAIGSKTLAHTLIDFNRAGVPLIEIVSEPDIRSPEDAFAYLSELKSVLRYCGASNCDMEKGELRCDVNVSVRPKGSSALGARAEVKNVNSFKAARDSIAYEFKRQTRELSEGRPVVQETRLWASATGSTESMRSKEEAHDYRYFPDPDLVPLTVSDDRVRSLRAALPELPAARRGRFVDGYGLTAYDAEVLTADKDLADYFEAAAKTSGEPKKTSNWVQVELLARLKESGAGVSDCPVPPEALGRLVRLISDGTVSVTGGKEVFAKMWETGNTPEGLVDSLGLTQVSDAAGLAAWVDEALAENPKAVADFKAGNAKAAGAIVGTVMKKSKGKANPGLVSRMIKEKIG